jgi:hypothetical protein
MLPEKLPREVLKLLAARATEAAGLLKLIAPLCKRPAGLTQPEAELLVSAVRNADQVLSDAVTAYYDASHRLFAEREAGRSAVAKVNGAPPQKG